MKNIKAITVEFDDGTTVGFKPEAENPSLPANRVRVIRTINEEGAKIAKIEWAGVTDGYNLREMTHRNNADWSIHHTYLEHA